MIKYLTLCLVSACAPVVQTLTLEEQYRMVTTINCYTYLKGNDKLERFPDCLESFASSKDEFIKIMKVQDILNAK